ncbi:MAG: acetyl-CoA sensor PanZ family protein [Alcanivorax sp.]
MPVKLEHLTQPNDADWVDLEKIQNETAPYGLASASDLKNWPDDSHWFIGGRFNDRIIGALLAEKSGNAITLSAAGVRQITQRRGVMHQMLHFIQKWAVESGFSLAVKVSDDSLRASLLKRGFTTEGELLRYNHN